MVGILLSYWGGLFSGATLVSGRVFQPLFLDVFFGEKNPKEMCERTTTCDQHFEWVSMCVVGLDSLGPLKIQKTQPIPSMYGRYIYTFG